MTALAARCLVLLAFVLAAPVAAAEDDYMRPAEAEGADLGEGFAHAFFAAGCFWCTESDFEKLDGVVEAVSGYAGGEEPEPTYHVVSSGSSGHVESVRVIYDPQVINYEALLAHYWRNVDPFDADGQFCDRGPAYRPAIFPANPEQEALAQSSFEQISARFDEPVVVEIRGFGTFWPAEAAHQNYARNNPIRYQRYRFGCGRDQRLRRIWNE